MRSLLLSVAVVALVATAAMGRTLDPSCPSYDTAVDLCFNHTGVAKEDRCQFWRCVTSFCYKSYVKETAAKACDVSVAELTASVKQARIPSHIKIRADNHKSVGTPNAASPCGGGNGALSKDQIRHWLLDTSMDVYYDRANEHYTEGSQRWSGIDGHVCPHSAPKYSDCSSTVTWIYWTLFGNGADFINGENWKAGYTGTMDVRGSPVSSDEADLKVGDLCFYYNPVGHVAIYVGGGNVVSHGADPVGLFNYRAMPLNFCRRYIE